MTGAGPFADPDIKLGIKKHMEAVYGECPVQLFAPKPSEVAIECSTPLPNACPGSLWGLNRIKAPRLDCPPWHRQPKPFLHCHGR